MFTMIQIRKTVTKFGKVRRVVEIPKEYYDVIQAGDKVTIMAKENKGGN